MEVLWRWKDMVVAMKNAHNDLDYAMEVKESGFPNFEKPRKIDVFWPPERPTRTFKNLDGGVIKV